MKNSDIPVELVLYKKDPISELKIIYVFDEDFASIEDFEDFIESLKQRCYCVIRYPYRDYYVKV